MCQFITIHVEESDFRYVGQCEHNTVFINWMTSSWHIAPNDFFNLVIFVQNAQTTPQQPLRNGVYSLEWMSITHPRACLWMGASGLMLGAEDWIVFVRLLESALPMVQEFLITPRIVRSRLRPQLN